MARPRRVLPAFSLALHAVKVVSCLILPTARLRFCDHRHPRKSILLTGFTFVQ